VSTAVAVDPKGWRRPKILEQNDQHRLH
jgi:hypothetical protein